MGEGSTASVTPSSEVRAVTARMGANQSMTPLAWARAEVARLHALTTDSEALRAAVGTAGHADAARPVVAAALEFLSRHAPGSYFLRAADEIVSVGSRVVPSRAISRVAAILEDWARFVEDGMMAALPFPVMARMEAATDLMEQVQQLLSEESIHPAAPVVLAGAALEEFLRSQIAAAGLTPAGKPGISTYANALRSAGHLSAQDVKDITAWAGQRNDAAHGQFSNLSRQRAQIMVDGINLFMRTKTEGSL
jgi:hypothetical protein